MDWVWGFIIIWLFGLALLILSFWSGFFRSDPPKYRPPTNEERLSRWRDKHNQRLNNGDNHE